MCFGGKAPAPVPPPPPPPPTAIPIIGAAEDAGGYSGKKKKTGMAKLQIPLTKADTSSGLGIPGV